MVLTTANPDGLNRATLVAELTAAGAAANGTVTELRLRLAGLQAAAGGGQGNPGMEVELAQLRDMRNRNIIDQQAYVAAVTAVATRRPSGPSQTNVPAVVTVEDSVKTGEKQLGAQVRAWAGTFEAPHLDAEAYTAVEGHAETDLLREKIADLKVATALNKKAARMLLEAGPGVTPLCLVGTTETHVIARLAIWSFITEVTVLCATELCLADGSRDARAEFRETLRTSMAVCSSAAAKTAFTTGVGKLKAAHTTAYKVIGKRVREEEVDSTNRPRGGRGFGRGSGNNQSIKCNYCHSRGHIEAHCNKKTTDKNRSSVDPQTRGGRGGTGRGFGRGGKPEVKSETNE